MEPAACKRGRNLASRLFLQFGAATSAGESLSFPLPDCAALPLAGDALLRAMALSVE